jgi:hypothetical protein
MFDDGSCSLINIWREKKSVPVLEGKVLSKTSFVDQLNHTLMSNEINFLPLGFLKDQPNTQIVGINEILNDLRVYMEIKSIPLTSKYIQKVQEGSKYYFCVRSNL